MNKKLLLALPLLNLILSKNQALADNFSATTDVSQAGIEQKLHQFHPKTLEFIREMVKEKVLAFSEDGQDLLINTEALDPAIVANIAEKSPINTWIEGTPYLKLTDEFVRSLSDANILRELFSRNKQDIQNLITIEKKLRDHNGDVMSCHGCGEAPYEGY